MKEILVGLLFSFIAILLHYVIFYIVLYIIFWAFGGTLFGYAFSWKIALGIYMLYVFYNITIGVKK